MVDLRIYQNEIKTKASKLQKEVNEMQGKLHKEHTRPTMSFKSHLKYKKNLNETKKSLVYYENLKSSYLHLSQLCEEITGKPYKLVSEELVNKTHTHNPLYLLYILQ
jgi:hypothetical protein